MIKIGILGAETMAAGELIRILINHPDVTIKTIASEQESGHAVTSLHRGLTGDIDMKVTSTLSPDGLDAVFLCGEAWEAKRWMERYNSELTSELRIIDLTGAFRNGEYGMEYGFPEYNRKALVRGATRASIPSAVATAIELALFPLAKNGALNGTANASVSIASSGMHQINATQADNADENFDRITSTRLDPIAPQENRPDMNAITQETMAALRMMQPSFYGGITLQLSCNSKISRGLTAVIDVPCGIELPELKRMYAEAYSDHGFTFPVDEQPTMADVANTNKCLVQLEYPDSPSLSGMPHLRVTTVIDNLLKGGAGTAVHCMNLLFGLSERTGLSLKASAF